MRSIITVVILICSMLGCYQTGTAQFDVAAYKKFLEENKNLTKEQLLTKYPAGYFVNNTNTNVNSAEFFDSVNTKFELTQGEKNLIQKHGFVVTERVHYPSFSAGFYDVYTKDLPLYISSDAILHALHRSYDNMLKKLELRNLHVSLFSILTNLHKEMLSSDPNIAMSNNISHTAINDADVYLTVARYLVSDFNGFAVRNALFPENQKTVDSLITLIKNEKISSFALFSSTPREIDFSQFKPRGHYTQDQYLIAYFRAMMWLGRTELYITAPNGAIIPPTKDDIRRQCALSILLAQMAQRSDTVTVPRSEHALTSLNRIDKIISMFVGPQDNLTTNQLLSVLQKEKITALAQLADDATLERFQNAAIKEGAEQRILSQILSSDGDIPVKPATAYMLMGQRFIIDSYIFMNVVHDKVALRMMPSTLDAMFALGNNSALQLSGKDLGKYESYPSHLAGLRYLVDGYGGNDWNSSFYSGWMNGIRMLNPKTEDYRSTLPKFMQTSAWWQKTLNTQLASWAELRHDNLLYAKPSYTAILGCFYPKGFVEPVPELYASVGVLAQRMLDSIPSDSTMNYTLQSYVNICKHLASMSRKELNHEQFDKDEEELISNWIIKNAGYLGCERITQYTGYYQTLLYGVNPDIRNDDKPDFVVADVHTQPSDEAGNTVGKVLHVGTGAPSLAVIVANDNDECSTTYCGPVSSYFEFVSQNFMRLTDEEWKQMYLAQSHRPDLVHLYMADSTGNNYTGDAPTLLMGIHEPESIATPVSQVQNYPNPFVTNTMIGFEVPRSLSGSLVTVTIYTLNGEAISELISQPLEAGNYAVRWDGTSSNGVQMLRGAYLYRLHIGKHVFTSTMILGE